MARWNPIDWLLGPQRVCVDPVLGRLRCRGQRPWHGVVHFPPVKVSIVTGGAEPGEHERATFLELISRYDAMRPRIAQALYDLYEEAGKPEGMKEWLPISPEGMIAMTYLDEIEIEREAKIRLFYCFADGLPFKHELFTIRVEGWTPIGEDLRD